MIDASKINVRHWLPERRMTDEQAQEEFDAHLRHGVEGDYEHWFCRQCGLYTELDGVGGSLSPAKKRSMANRFFGS